MKKTFIMNFEYIPGCEKIIEAFDVEPDDLLILTNAVKNTGQTNIGDIMIDFLESGKITGSEIMALATMKLLTCVQGNSPNEGFMKNFEDIMKRFMEGGK